MTTTTSQLVIVSNRLPITLSKQEDGWKFSMSSGGLVSALSSVHKTTSFTWIGWPGFEIPEEDKSHISERLLTEHSCFPVFLPEKTADLYYNGFSNSILWPLFHYLPGDIDFDDAQWQAYREANEKFADATLQMIHDGDYVWVQDYHLMLLPSILRERLTAAGRRNVRIGFFLHTPFPSSEVFRVLPVGKPLLTGVLQCDLVGFHTFDYARHFLSSCTRILGLSTVPTGVELDGRLVRVGAFPIGIDPDKFLEGLQEGSIQDRIRALKERFQGKRILLGVDRLDYIKGVPHKLYALEKFLAQHPEFRDQVVLVQVAVPSRMDVEEYQHLTSVVNELVGRINGKYGSVEFMPIHFLHKSINFEELTALYAVADVCVVSSTRDGMNLVSYEYIACQQDRCGVLILSEFAGAAQSFNGALIVNPWNIDELAKAYFDALTMPEAARVANHQKLFRYVTKYTAAHWGQSFYDELKNVAAVSSHQDQMIPLSFSETKMQLYRPSGLKIFFLDYDGTLAMAQNLPEFARPSNKLHTLLESLCSLPDVLVYIMSGRTRATLDEWFDSTGTGCVAEHGSYYKHGRQWRTRLGVHACSDSALPVDKKDYTDWIYAGESMDPTESWKDSIRHLFQHYTDRTPGSFIEEKEAGLAWHYRNTDPEFGNWQAAEFHVNLEKLLSHIPVKVLTGNKTLELYPTSVDHSIAIRNILHDLTSLEQDASLIVCIGDGKSNESSFSLLSRLDPTSITCTVDKKRFCAEAKYYLESVFEALLFLEYLVMLPSPS